MCSFYASIKRGRWFGIVRIHWELLYLAKRVGSEITWNWNLFLAVDFWSAVEDYPCIFFLLYLDASRLVPSIIRSFVIMLTWEFFFLFVEIFKCLSGQSDKEFHLQHHQRVPILLQVLLVARLHSDRTHSSCIRPVDQPFGLHMFEI